jgi:signal transduction histidine kinase
MEHRFVSDAAHELKTSVAVLRSTVQLIALRRRTPEEYEAGLERVLQDNERVEQILQRMLMLGRFEEQTAEFRAVTDLSEDVRRTAQYLGSWIEEREVQLTLQLEDDVMIPMPAEAAEILVSNLLMNAVQHSPKGGRVEITVGCKLHPRKSATLQVKDAGQGIAPESLPHVFERFYREDSSRSRVTGGAGLGLAICKSIVENAKGSIQVESTLGCGTVVTATFSLA